MNDKKLQPLLSESDTEFDAADDLTRPLINSKWNCSVVFQLRMAVVLVRFQKS